ncbi:MAG: phosphopyruvate hydratase [Bacteriovoracaceae bacterium]|nr:phosphopyruvate hydratase [Bacteriovoracaceae bacterium]
MASIASIKSRQILDSRGNPTVECDVILQNGIMGRAAVPSGASTGSREAIELRDNNPKEYLGKGVTRCVQNITEVIAPKLEGMDVTKQEEIDRLLLNLDNSKNKSHLGANTLLAVSMACARAGALSVGKPLYQYLRENLECPTWGNAQEYIMPMPLMNVINGGAHAANNLDIQEFMIVPRLAAPFSRNLQAAVEVFHHLKKILSDQKQATNVGDEGGFAPDFASNEAALEVLLQSITKAGYQAGKDIYLSLDCAANEFYDSTKKLYVLEGTHEKTSGAMIEYYQSLVMKYPLYSIEDGLEESDYEGWKLLQSKLGGKINLVGDDLFVTNVDILAQGIKEKWANSILIKLNQIGTLTETLRTMELAKKNHMKAIVSHRSGETSDTFIADLAVATNCGHIKTGSASRGERIEKYNQLLRIEAELGAKAQYPQK